jgi:predicted dehydrogenase
MHQVAPRLRGACLTSCNVSPDQRDAAIVFVPGHESNVEPWLSVGKHVFLTPQANFSAERLKTFEKIALQANARLGLANPDRYLPSRQLIRQQLDAGKLGAPGLIRIHRWESARTLAALLVDLDLVFWYFGKTPTIAHAVGHASCVQAHLGFPNGGMALIDLVRSFPAGDSYYSLSLIGASGAAYADDHANMQLLFRDNATRAVRSDEGVMALTALAQDFIDAIRTGRDLSASLQEWYNVLAVGEAIGRSMATQQPASLQLD